MEKNKQSFMVGVITLFTAQVVVRILGLVYRLVITNIDGFGDAGNGLYGAGYQIYALLLAISSIGVPNAISKLVSERIAVGKEKEAHEIFKVAMKLFAGIGFILSILLFIFSGLIAKAIGNPNIKGIMISLSPGILFVSMASVIRGYFNGMYNMKATSNSQMLEQLFKSILTVCFVYVVAHISLEKFLWIAKLANVKLESKTVAMAIAGNLASTVSIILGFLYLLFYYLKKRRNILGDSKNKISKDKKKIIVKKILEISIPISIASIISAINKNIDTFTVVNGLKIALSHIQTNIDVITNEATRLYGILSGKIDILVGTPAALNIAFATALVPAISAAMASGDIKTVKRRIIFSLRTTLLIGLPCAVGMIVLAGPILNLLFPNAYSSEATILLKISSITIVFTLLSQTIGGALQGLGKVFVPAISLGVGACIKLFLNLLLIEHIEWNIVGGINGAAVSSVVASVVSFIINISFLLKSINLKISIKQFFIKPLIATIVMGVSAYYIYDLLSIKWLINPVIATISTLFISVLVYLLCVIIFKVLEKEDYNMLPYGEKIYSIILKLKLAKA